MKIIVLIATFVFSVLSSALAQDDVKSEVEKRIKESDFPQPALNLIDFNLAEFKRVKYYLEVDGIDTSYELKYNMKKQSFSIEFSVNGLLQDVERRIDFNDLASEVKERIDEYLKANYKKYKIKKVQIQYKQNNVTVEMLRELLNESFGQFKVAYEIEVAVKTKAGKPAMYEFHFDREGQFLDKRIFRQQGDDNILY